MTCAARLVQHQHGMAAGLDGKTDLGKMRLHGSVSAKGMTSPAALPLAGQIAPKM